MNTLQHARILSALTKHDEREQRKKHANPYALGHYCKALQNAQRHCDNGADLRLALLNCFNGRLLDKVLKAVDLPASTREECFVGGYEQLPEFDDLA